MDYEELGNEIFSLSPTIRFVEIYHDGEKFSKTRTGFDPLLSVNETEQSIKDSISRWKTRKQLSDKLGEPLYALAKYEKITRVTISFGIDGLIMISMRPDGFHEVIIKEIIDIKNKFLG